MIFATQGFANLGIITPDYIVPNGFFFPGNGTIDWAGAVQWTYANLPSDGTLSLNRDGSTSANSPTNFSGQTGTVTAGRRRRRAITRACGGDRPPAANPAGA